MHPTDLILDLSIKSMSAFNNCSLILTNSNPVSSCLITDNDEIKIFECDKHEDDMESDSDDNTDRLSPVIKEEEV